MCKQISNGGAGGLNYLEHRYIQSISYSEITPEWQVVYKYVHIHIYIHIFQYLCAIKGVGCGTNHSYTKTQIFNVNITDNWQKQYYKSRLLINEDSSAGQKECVCMYFLEALVNLSLLFLRVFTLCFKFLKIFMQHRMYFLEN